MPGITFWKHASGLKTDDTQPGPLGARRRREQKLKRVAFSGAAVAAVAIALGAPVVGISVYLLAILPLILFAS